MLAAVRLQATGNQLSELGLLTLGKKDGKTSAESDAVTGPLVIGGETSGVGALGDLLVEDLLEGVLARERLAVGVLDGDIHQMHFGGLVGWSEKLTGLVVW